MSMLTFRNDENINKIYDITDIMSTRVEIVSLKTNRLMPQCKRCQAYGHTQKYCAKEPQNVLDAPENTSLQNMIDLRKRSQNVYIVEESIQLTIEAAL